MVELSNITVDVINKKIRFEVISKVKITSIMLSFQQIKEYKHPKVSIEVPVANSGNKFYGEISLLDLYSKMLSGSPTTWNIVAKDHMKTYDINTSESILQQVGIINLLPLLTISFGQKATTQLYIKLIPISAKINKFKTEEKKTYISGILNTEILQLDNHKLILQAKRRPNTSLYNFHEEICEFPIKFKPEIREFEVELEWESLPHDFYMDEKNVCDFVIKVYNEYGHEVTAFLDIPEGFTKEMIEVPIRLSDSFRLIKPYITGSKRLSFYALKDDKNVVKLASYSEDDTYYYLDFILSDHLVDEKRSQLILKRRDKKGITFEYVMKINLGNVESGKFRIPKDTFLSTPGLIHASTWDFFLRIANIDYYIMVPDSLSFQSDYIYVQNQNYKTKLFIAPTKTLSCYTILSDKQSTNAINIAVMGTCFSRNMFNSGIYFNPGYKNVLNCVFTQFHSSIISIMTEPFEMDLDQYQDMSISERNFVKDDFAKEFFVNLRDSKAEYLLIDLYPDVIRPVIWVTEQAAVTLSYVIEESELLNDIPVKRILDHIDNYTFFNEWKKYADKFIEQLTEILPPERIILNKGRFTTSYYDKSRKKTDFPNKMLIERNNYFWDKLDNYFQSKLPTAQILDIRNKPYIGDINYPYGNSFSHYESNYYKDLYKDLSYIILKEKLNRV